MHAFREATREDCDAIGAVHVAACRETYAGLLPGKTLAELSPERRAAMGRRFLDRNGPDRPLLAAGDADGAIVGFAACWRPPAAAPLGTDAEVSAISGLRRAQRRGTGRVLMARLFAFMAARGMASAGLWVLRGNEPARAFYRALGAVEDGERSEEADGHVHVEVSCAWRPLPA